MLETNSQPSGQGSAKKMVDWIIKQRGRGNVMLEGVTRTKLMLKGINPANFFESTPDDPIAIVKLTNIAKELGVSFNGAPGLESVLTGLTQRTSRF